MSIVACIGLVDVNEQYMATPDSLCDDSMYLMEEAIERALQGASISYA